MSKHTPGPWFVQDGYLTIYNLSDGTVGTTCAIAKVLREQPGDEQAEVNARLIAAAPELLEALTDLLGVTEEVAKKYGLSYSELESYNAAARAAIRKATGEE